MTLLTTLSANVFGAQYTVKVVSARCDANPKPASQYLLDCCPVADICGRMKAAVPDTRMHNVEVRRDEFIVKVLLSIPRSLAFAFGVRRAVFAGIPIRVHVCVV